MFYKVVRRDLRNSKSYRSALTDLNDRDRRKTLARREDGRSINGALGRGGNFLLTFENAVDFNTNDVKIHVFFWNLHKKIVEKMWLTHQNSLKNG